MSPAKSRLVDLDLGRFDAESDTNLLEYFLDTGVVADVRRNGKYLVIGRKGSGKTALFRYLSDNADAVAVPLDLDDYVWELHRGFVEQGLVGERAYAASWRLLVYVAALGAIGDRLTEAQAKRVDAALHELGIGRNRGRIAAIFGWLRRVRRIDLPEVTGVASVGGIEIGDDEDSPLSVKTADAITSLGEVLQEVTHDVPFVVLIDRLDDAWDGSDDSLNLIAGAIRATRDIALAHRRHGIPPVVTFLRADLWEKVSFNDRNKISQDIVFLDWDADELADVVGLRIQRSLGIPV